MDREEIFTLIRKALSEDPKEEDEIKWGSRLVEDLRIDGPLLIEMILPTLIIAEEKFGAEYPEDEELKKIRTVGDAVKLIETLLQ